MNDNLAQLMFEAHEHERLVRGDFAGEGRRGNRPRRWTELPLDEQDCWEKAAAVARKTVIRRFCSGVLVLAEHCDQPTKTIVEAVFNGRDA